MRRAAVHVHMHCGDGDSRRQAQVRAGVHGAVGPLPTRVRDAETSQEGGVPRNLPTVHSCVH